MSVRLLDNAIVLDGDCGVEDAEVLLGYMEGNTSLPIEFGLLGKVHTALWQVLIMTGAIATATSADPFYRNHLIPALKLSGDLR